MEFSLAWKDGNLNISVPDKNIKAVLDPPEPVPSLADPHAALIEALEDPIGSPPLRELVKPRDKVALLVGDVANEETGRKHGFGQIILNLLSEQGVPDSNVVLIHAAGMHEHGDARKRFGETLLSRVRYVEHDGHNPDHLTFVGVTQMGTPLYVNRWVMEADVKIGIGACGVSRFQGYQGGGGIILPGASGADTVYHNHRYIMFPRPLAGVGRNNPIKEDIQEAADTVGLTFKIDLVRNGSSELGAIFAGHHRHEWPEAVAFSRKVYSRETERADIFILLSHSPSLDICSSMNFIMAERALRPGGIILLVASGTEYDPEHPTFVDMKRGVAEMAHRLTRSIGDGRLNAIRYSTMATRDRTWTFLVSAGIGRQEAEALGFKYWTDSFDHALNKAMEEVGKDAEILVSPPPNVATWVEDG